ncbi:MAG: hypothetical protein ACP5TY_06705 [Thermodesulforhabdaceae bacterium]
MLDTYEIYEELLSELGDAPARSIARVIGRVYRDLGQTVTKDEFNRLASAVSELVEVQQQTGRQLALLAEAQSRTEERLNSLTQRVEELAEAQKRTEKCIEELAEAQKRTEERLDSLTQRVEELAEAQRRTEERLEALTARVDSLAQRVEELAEAQKRTEERLDSLTQRVEELAEAQRRTEERLEALTARVDSLAQRVEELAEAQKRTEERLDSLAQRVEELAEAQKRTEERLEKLAAAQEKVEKELRILTERVDRVETRLENLSDSFGYYIENKAYRSLPALLEKHGILVQGRLNRRYLGKHQINIYGKALIGDREVTIIGECKTRPSQKEVGRFDRIVSYLQREGAIQGEVVRIFVSHDFPPEVEAVLQDKKILYFWSYELEM